MKKKLTNILCGTLGCIAGLLLVACEEEGLLVNSNDIAYLKFTKDMSKDTTTVSFKMYEEGQMALIPIEVSVYGKIQTDDLSFEIAAIEDLTTLPKELYVLPTDCKIRKGLLTDTVYVGLKNNPMLATETRRLALQIVETTSLKKGDYLFSRALINVTDRLFQPDWWLVNDEGDGETHANSVDWYYLGTYSETKYKMFLDELKKDGVVFDGKDKMVLRKYSLRLKNTLKKMNEGKPQEEWVRDEYGAIITVVVAG